MTFTKIDPADLDSPRWELSIGGLKSVVSLLIRWQIIFLLAQTLMLNPAVIEFCTYCGKFAYDVFTEAVRGVTLLRGTLGSKGHR